MMDTIKHMAKPLYDGRYSGGLLVIMFIMMLIPSVIWNSLWPLFWYLTTCIIIYACGIVRAHLENR